MSEKYSSPEILVTEFEMEQCIAASVQNPYDDGIGSTEWGSGGEDDWLLL